MLFCFKVKCISYLFALFYKFIIPAAIIKTTLKKYCRQVYQDDGQTTAIIKKIMEESNKKKKRKRKECFSKQQMLKTQSIRDTNVDCLNQIDAILVGGNSNFWSKINFEV